MRNTGSFFLSATFTRPFIETNERKDGILMDKRVFLYGFNELHHVVSCKYIREGRVTVTTMNQFAECMFDERPDIRRIYAVDNRIGLKQDFLDTIIRPHFTKDIEFEDMISREGICAWKR